MSYVITLPRQLYDRLTLKSRRAKRTPDDVVVELVQQYLGQSDDSWQTEFRALVARVNARTVAFAADEIEADISQAAAEARELRCARRVA